MDGERLKEMQGFIKELYKYGITLVPNENITDVQSELSAMGVEYKYETVGEIYEVKVPAWQS